MAATVEWKVYTDTGTENPSTGSATNLNLMSIDAYDSTGTEYTQYPIPVPETGTNYSYERWFRLKFSGSFNQIDNIKFWHSSGTLSDPNLDLRAGATDTFSTPVNTESSVATKTLSEWDEEAEAIDITPAGGITSSPGYSKYGVIQLVVPSTVTTPGDIGTHTITVRYDEC